MRAFTCSRRHFLVVGGATVGSACLNLYPQPLQAQASGTVPISLNDVQLATAGLRRVLTDPAKRQQAIFALLLCWGELSQAKHLTPSG